MDVQNKQASRKKWLYILIPICILSVSILICLLILLTVWIGGRIVLSSVQSGTDSVTSNLINGHEGAVTMISENELRDVLEISELSTAEYSYNAVMRAYEEDGTTEKYYVAYNATVTVGIDFEDIIITVDDENKTIKVQVPNCKITDTIVDFGSMEFIFPDSTNQSETISQEAYELCQEDLMERVKEEKYLFIFAKENAIAVVEGLIEPWVEQIDDEYTITVE